MPPLIGVTRGARPPVAYRRALEAAGAAVEEIGPGTPRAEAALVDPAAALAGLSGLLLTGGADVAPELYGAREVHPTVRVEPERDRFELPLVRAALAAGLPVFGICRGIQTLNVAAGGTLWQDLPSEKPGPVVHKEPEDTRDRRRRLHPVTPLAGSLLAAIVGPDPLPVNSIHHQAVRNPAPGLHVVALAPDGVVEGLEAPDLPFVLGVQWHPEEVWEDDPRQAALFAAFVQAAERRR